MGRSDHRSGLPSALRRMALTMPSEARMQPAAALSLANFFSRG